MKKIGLIFLIIGVTFLSIQNTFYGYLDADGFVQDSLFLPLGVLSTSIGVLFIFIVVIKVGIKK